MNMKLVAPLALLLLAACDGNPFLEEEVPDPEELPGTENPAPDRSITRFEPTGEPDSPEFGNGFAQDFGYDAATDTYTVDNLGFDGANAYGRGTAVATLGSYNVYEATATEEDPRTGIDIPQFQHRLIAGISDSGRTEFAIVRTGAYLDYGFGGFVLKREGGVNLPTTQQAAYSGDYAAVRDFNGTSGLEYATGDMTVAIDFEDFNDGDAVQGQVTNRQIFDINGNNITGTILAAIDAKFDPDDVVGPSTVLPTLNFRVGPGVIDTNGEIRGLLDSVVVDRSGDRPEIVEYEAGNYYAIVSGDNADEVVGIIVVEAEDPRFDGVTARETGGFILYRP
ncbi:MAG: hypothetical protein ACT4OK_01630 [Gemmobacter sp.]